ncbi:MAG: TRAP transporter large permease subunit [Rhodoferax sp.]|nr:TRAP transporter large permease subunit [Rhodoferax sp.]
MSVAEPLDAGTSDVRSTSRTLPRRILDALDVSLTGLGVLCLIGIASVTMAGVVSRYVFNNSFTWTAEAGQWLFIYLIFLGVPLAHRSRMHIAIGAIDKVMPESMKRVHAVLVDGLVSYTTIALMFGAKEVIGLIGGTSTALGLPSWLQYAGIPLSCGVGLVYIALRDLDAKEGRWLGSAGVLLGVVLFLGVDVPTWVYLPQGHVILTMALSFVLTLLLGVPVAFSMLFSVFMANASNDILPAPAVVQNVVRGSGQFLMLAIPLFLLAGALMNIGGLTQRLIDFSYSLVRHLRGGMGQVTIVSATLYAGISGSSNADAALAAKMLHPSMVRDGYKPAFSAAICAAGAVLPNIIPPSIGMLIVAAATGISVGQLFMAGIGPGLLFAAFLMATVWVVAKRNGYGASAPKATWGERGRAGMAAVPVMILALFIIGSLRFGIATPTETGAIAVTYALFLGLFVFRTFELKSLYKILATTAVDSALIGLLIGAALPFGFVLTTERVPQDILAFATQWMGEKWGVLLFLNLVMLAAGMFLDIGAAILILAPLFLPLVVSVGVDPVHFGVIVICNLMIGGLTPPVGILAYIVATITRLEVTDVFTALWPLMAALIFALALITYVPAISLGLLWLSAR